MSFNFSSLGDVKPASTTNYLKPYTINDNVVIKAAEIKTGTSKTSGNEWKSLQITFGNDEGIYNDSIFWISSENDFKRNKVAGANGGERELPSAWERTRDKIAAIGQAFFADDFAKIQSVSSKIKSFDELMTLFKKALDKNIGKTATSMKLIGRTNDGSVYATLPNCTGIAQAKDEKQATSNGVNVGDWFTWMISPFGNRLFFSAYEERQKNELANAKPTEMENTNDIAVQVDGSTSDDLDFESLL